MASYMACRQLVRRQTQYSTDTYIAIGIATCILYPVAVLQSSCIATS